MVVFSYSTLWFLLGFAGGHDRMVNLEYMVIIRNCYRISSKEEGMSSTSASMTAVQRRATKTVAGSHRPGLEPPDHHIR